jgi:L-histidine Nalpha-methyltransferase
LRAASGSGRPALPARAGPPPAADRLREFAADVRSDLARTPRQLQSKYLYDALGSCLFEAICRLPWYRITTAESHLLARHADAIIAAAPDPVTFVELGCGSGEKLALLGEGLRRAGRSARVHLIDISAQALEQSVRTLGRFDHVSVVGHRLGYGAGLRAAARQREPGGAMLVLLLGSNIGNFDRPAADEFLAEIRGCLQPGDALLLGADLVKPEAELLLAYDDPLGVTAAFNRNVLKRINLELGGTFDLTAFAHRAVWRAAGSRIEMHLVCTRPHRVRIPAAGTEIHFQRGETIWTESSYKYEPEGVRQMGAAAGFRSRHQWIEPDARFALTLLEAV